jgi:hypothetical protein
LTRVFGADYSSVRNNSVFIHNGQIVVVTFVFVWRGLRRMYSLHRPTDDYSKILSFKIVVVL